MRNNAMKQLLPVVKIAGFFLWLVMNIRVEAGIALPFERALDGLVGGLVLLGSVFLALRFFLCPDRDE